MEDDEDSDSSNDPLVKVEVISKSAHAEENGAPESGSNTFKIVQTIEDGKLCLWTVPKAWESGGLLRWPRFKVGKLRRDPLSKPTDSWPITNCILIKSDLVSFEFAETVIRFMNDTSDVEEISEVVTNGDTIQPLNFKSHDLAEGHSESYTRKATALTTPKEVPVETEAEMEDFASILVIPAENHRSSFQPKKIVLKAAVTSDTSATTYHSEISSKIDSLCTLVSAIAQDQQVLVKNQEIILNKISVLTQKFEHFCKRQPLKPFMQFSPGNFNKYPSTREIKPICNRADLDELEQSLEDATTATELRETYSVVCGNGKGRGINNAYMLLDFMFDRDFLTQCSWAGGSRSLDSKLCFKSYRNVINFFFQIVHASDKRFTWIECHNFFKQVLRNATKRAQMKGLRASTSRRRNLFRRTTKNDVGNGGSIMSENKMDETDKKGDENDDELDARGDLKLKSNEEHDILRLLV